VSTVFPKNNDNVDIAVAVRHNYWFCNRWHSDCWSTRSADILSLFWTYDMPTHSNPVLSLIPWHITLFELWLY